MAASFLVPFGIHGVGKLAGAAVNRFGSVELQATMAKVKSLLLLEVKPATAEVPTLGEGVGEATCRNSGDAKLNGSFEGQGEICSKNNVYDGVKQASEYLKEQGVPRLFRKQILESFDIRTIKLKVAGEETYGLRFYGGNANAEGRYLFETFSPLINRENLALPYEWNSMAGIQQFKVKCGTIIITGDVASQTRFGEQFIGGAHQWFINNMEDLIKCH